MKRQQAVQEQKVHQDLKQTNQDLSKNGTQYYQQMMKQILKDLQRYPHSYYVDQKGNIIMRSIEQIQRLLLPNSNLIQQNEIGPGRGGNNVSENIKKAIRSTLKRFFSKQLFEQFESKYINRFNMKSQKQNYILFFLFFHKLLIEQKISRKLLQTLKEDIIEKIKKYIKNSELRLQQETHRKEFHQKNIREFQKFLKINVDFTEKQSIQQIKSQLKILYLRKVSVYKQAVKRVIRIISQFQDLKSLFEDINSEEDSDSLSGVSLSQSAVKMELSDSEQEQQ